MFNTTAFKNTVTILSLMAALLTLFVFITGKQSLASVFQSDKADQEIVIDTSDLKDDTNTSSDKENAFYRFYVWNSSNWWKTIGMSIIVFGVIFFTLYNSKGIWHDIYEFSSGILFVICLWSVIFAITSYVWNLFF